MSGRGCGRLMKERLGLPAGPIWELATQVPEPSDKIGNRRLKLSRNCTKHPKISANDLRSCVCSPSWTRGGKEARGSGVCQTLTETCSHDANNQRMMEKLANLYLASYNDFLLLVYFHFLMAVSRMVIN